MRTGSRLVLQLLADGRISVDEAHDLLAALNGGPAVAAEDAEPRQQRQSSRPDWTWNQSGFPFSTLTPADLLGLIFRGLAPNQQRRGSTFDDQSGFPFSTLTPADLLGLIFQALAPDQQRRDSTFD